MGVGWASKEYFKAQEDRTQILLSKDICECLDEYDLYMILLKKQKEIN